MRVFLNAIPLSGITTPPVLPENMLLCAFFFACLLLLSAFHQIFRHA